MNAYGRKRIGCYTDPFIPNIRLQLPSETAVHATTPTRATTHAAMSTAHRAKGAGAKPMMERRTTAIPATHKEGEAAEETSEQSPSHKQPTAAELLSLLFSCRAAVSVTHRQADQRRNCG